MLGIKEIKSQTLNRSGSKSFLSITFKAETSDDVTLLIDIFWFYLNNTFSGFSDEHQPTFTFFNVIKNKEQTIYFDWKTTLVTLK